MAEERKNMLLKDIWLDVKAVQERLLRKRFIEIIMYLCADNSGTWVHLKDM